MGFIGLKPTIVSGAVIPAQNLPVGSSTASFATFNASSQVVALQVLGGNVYCTLDGTAPSSSNGATLFQDQAYHWGSQTAQRAKFLEVTGAATVYAQECVTAMSSSELPAMEIWHPALG